MSEDEKPVDDEALADEWAAALAEQDDDEVDAPAQAQPVELENLQDTGVRGSSANSPNMDVILDIPVT
ncbi:MAG: flagellar motor switch protein FliN, partial [Ketobacter sp.]